ncbi:hypothetical protein BCR44DRAFT_1255482 [Catenaria anguillulae PL171]|uniref:Transcription initiation factor IIF subunit alpha n=1 Tax=Catenaria anguillulae PL171 TaxID=765915 RepID=A0A1Y2HBT0_9FUNG|nr:hypothetical protein BCR44DRAFT_1255482 [Catenaria anguillulae PL171]
MGMAAAALGTPADDHTKGKEGEQQKKYPLKKEKQVADPSKIAPYGGARVPTAAVADDDADPAATPATTAASAAAPKSSAFQKRTREIRMVDDAVRLARREEITPWVLHGADPGASEKAARKLKRRTLRKMLLAAGKTNEAERLESSEEEEEEEEEAEAATAQDKNGHEHKIRWTWMRNPGRCCGSCRSKWTKVEAQVRKGKVQIPRPRKERARVFGCEGGPTERVLFVYPRYRTRPRHYQRLDGTLQSDARVQLVQVCRTQLARAHHHGRPSGGAHQAQAVSASGQGAPTSAAAKLLHRLNQSDSASGDADGGASGTGRVSIKRAGGGSGSGGAGGKDWGDVDELDFDLTEQFADDEEDVVGDLEDENEGFKSQIKQMFALGLGGEAMDEDFDEDFLVEDTAGAAAGGANAARSGGSGAGTKELSSGGKQMIKLLRSQGYESEDDDDEWFGSDEEGEDGEGPEEGAGQDAAEAPAAGGSRPSDAVMRALAAAATAKAKAAATANGSGQTKRSASAANLDPAPKNGSGGQNPNPPPPPFSRDEIRATLRSRGPLTAGQLIQALPRGQEQIAVYGKEAFVEVLKASMVQKDANKKLHLRQ